MIRRAVGNPSPAALIAIIELDRVLFRLVRRFRPSGKADGRGGHVAVVLAFLEAQIDFGKRDHLGQGCRLCVSGLDECIASLTVVALTNINLGIPVLKSRRVRPNLIGHGPLRISGRQRNLCFSILEQRFQHRQVKGHSKALCALNIDRLVRRAGINADAQLGVVHLGHGQACFIVCRCCKSRCDAKAQHHRNYEQSR